MKNDICGRQKILVVIPAYNEEESIRHTVEELKAYIEAEKRYLLEYIVVNDGSRDSTVAVCKSNSYPCLDLPINTGLSSAFQSGMKYAHRNGYDYVIQFDADGQHEARYIGKMLSAAFSDGADLVIGSRFMNERKKMSMRMLGSSFISAMIKVTTGKTIKDPTSGFRLFGRELIVSFARDSNYAPEPDTVAFAIRNGAKVIEVPVTMRNRFAGKSYLTAAKSLSYMVRMGLSILFFQWVRKA